MVVDMRHRWRVIPPIVKEEIVGAEFLLIALPHLIVIGVGVIVPLLPVVVLTLGIALLPRAPTIIGVVVIHVCAAIIDLVLIMHHLLYAIH